MKNKVTFGLCAAIGLVIAGAGIILNKLKERVTFDNHTL